MDDYHRREIERISTSASLPFEIALPQEDSTPASFIVPQMPTLNSIIDWRMSSRPDLQAALRYIENNSERINKAYSNLGSDSPWNTEKVPSRSRDQIVREFTSDAHQTHAQHEWGKILDEITYLMSTSCITSSGNAAKHRDKDELELRTGRYKAIIDRTDGTLKHIELSFVQTVDAVQSQYKENNLLNAQSYDRIQRSGNDGQRYLVWMFLAHELELAATPLEETIISVIERSKEIDALQLEMRDLAEFGIREIPYSESNSAMARFLEENPKYLSLLSAHFEELLQQLPVIWQQIEAQYDAGLITDFDVFAYSYRAMPDDSLSKNLKKHLLERRAELRAPDQLSEPMLTIEQQLSEFRAVGKQLAYLVGVADPEKAKKLTQLVELATSYQCALQGNEEILGDIRTLYLDLVFERWNRGAS